MIGPSQKRSLIWAMVHVAGIAGLVALATTARVQGQEDAGQVAETASEAFALNCFSPFMTAARAAEVLEAPGVRVDFYDLDPFSDAAPSPVTGRAATTGTDRRCEVAFDGEYGDFAASAAVAGLEAEGIRTEAPIPDRYRPTEGTALLGARQLNPRRVAVVHVGTRPGPNGIETFLLVERLMPIAP
ncbi:succinyl-CoA synthetase subunit beta [Gymnodinialimonas hymeniacidonis]|uniref:succinyl-CoA synthetase subunit beta n=1 Tax=Gymnodinialimonas hymeniacidonis TaxID=3126508 RepID=UPI0034C697D9